MKPLQEEFDSMPAKLARDKQAFLDQAAMMAMQGYVAGGALKTREVAEFSFDFAEALWEERERRKQ